jgi:hypothetical protein
MEAGGVMPYVIPPMEDEPPADFVVFVARHLTALKDEAARLTGGDRHADELYPVVLTDVAGHWRRLRWRCRLRSPDSATAFLARRLAARSKQWREDQIYPVEVSVGSAATTWAPANGTGTPSTGTPSTGPSGWGTRRSTGTIRPAAPDTVARRLAAVLPSTTRAETAAVAEAGIAWVHAYRRYCWRRTGRVVGGGVLLVGAMIQVMSRISAS